MAPLRCANASSSAAWLFLRLASLRHSAVSAATASKARPSSAPPEFLLPLGLSTRAAPAPRRACRPDSLVSRASLVASSVVSEPSVRRRRRFFSTSPAKYATACVRNPVIDDQGNEMMLEITPRAAMRLSEIMVKDANPNLALRIQVESGGCHGFQYLMSLVTIPPKDASASSSAVDEGDSVFQYVPEEGVAPLKSPEAPKIILDEPSLELLTGSKVDFTQELIGSQFKITDNPHATSSCGCGTSFDVKI